MCIKSLGISTVANFYMSNASIVELINTLSVATVSEVVSSFFIVCLSGSPYANDLTLMSPFLFCFSNISDDKASLCSSFERYF